MRIANIALTPFEIPLVKPTRWAAGYMTKVDWVLVRIEGDDGTYGIAEAIPRPMIYGETRESIYYAITKYLAPLLVGEDSFALERIWEKMDSLAGNPAAKAAIDIALYDLNGKILGLPVATLLGGPYRTEVDLVWMVAMMPEDDMIDEMKRKVAEGFRSFKVKVGLTPAEDVAMLRRMKREVPDGVRLYMDANMGYDKETAYRVLRALEDVLDCVEEPMIASDDQGRLDLARRVSVPLLGDDSVLTMPDFYRQIQLGALKRISIKMPRTGFTLARKAVNIAEAANVKLQINTQSETTIGTFGCLHLAAAFRQISLPNEITFYLDVCDSLLKTDPVIVNGRMRLNQGAGLGMDVDWDKVKEYAV